MTMSQRRWVRMRRRWAGRWSYASAGKPSWPGILCCRRLLMVFRTSWMVKGHFSSCLLWAWLKT